jgi:hypothetical protein
MKQVIVYCILVVVLFSCYPATKITGSWKNPAAPSRNYKTVFIAALTANNIARSTLENHLEEALAVHGIKSFKSINEFPPNFQKDSLTREAILNSVQSNKNEAILTVTILRKETESRYVRGTYAPMGVYGYYGNFWGYYSYLYPYAYSPGYYTVDEVYYLETNLYDSKTEALVWSAQSQTYSYRNMNTFSRNFARLIVDKMIKDAVLINDKKNPNLANKTP